MPLNKLKRQFEDRRLSLIDTLQKGKDKLELSKQHQLYGAIKEIEQFLTALDYHREQQIAGADFELRKEGPQALSTRMAEGIKTGAQKTAGFIGSTVYAVYDKVILGTGRAISRTGKRYRMYKQVMREVKEREKKVN